MLTGTLTLAIFDESTGWALPERHVHRLGERAGSAWNVRAVSSRTQLLEAMGETVGLVGLPLTEEQLAPHVGRLRWIQLARSAGDASPALESAMTAGVRVSSASTARAPQVAEHALALTLAHFRCFDLATKRQREHLWNPVEIAGLSRTLMGATVSVVGVPPLIREVSARANAFGANVIGCAVGSSGVERLIEEDVDRALPLEALHDAASAADVLIVAPPRYQRTASLIGRKVFSAMKPASLLVDVSKGGIVDHPALIEALRRGRIASAALDVFPTEPLPSNSPLWTMPNVTMTPHVSSAGEGYWDRLIEHAGDNAARAASGESLIDELPASAYATAS